MHMLQELTEEVLADIPPEALLQRPHQLAHLFRLLQPADVRSAVPQAVLLCLLDLVKALRKSHELALDPDLTPHIWKPAQTDGSFHASDIIVTVMLSSSTVAKGQTRMQWAYACVHWRGKSSFFFPLSDALVSVHPDRGLAISPKSS